MHMAPKTKSERFELRIDAQQLGRVEKWATEQSDHPTKAEAIRRLIDRGLSAGSSRAVNFSDGEKMLILMMSDVYKALKIQNPESSPEFLAQVIYGGHYWAPKWKMQGVFHDHVDDPDEVRYVVDVLDMWSFIEEAYEALGPADHSSVEKKLGSRSSDLKFHGFDGNNEASQIGVARFLVEKMGRFTRFSNRELNSHCPTFAKYNAMLETFLPIRKTLTGTKLSAAQLIEILKSD